MEHTTVSDIVNAAGGKLLCGDPERPVLDIAIDSRKVKEGDLYVPIVGERVDGHQFIDQAFRNGAAAVLTSRRQTMDSADAWIQVEDTRDALQAIGAWYRDRLEIPIIGITGSVGKTTTREMIGTALSAGYRVYKTPGNSNSQVGVPITISEISRADQIGVIELGMSEPGEMHRIAMVAKVNQAVITNIGVAHIEQLGSQENILREKLHILDGMKPEGILYVNGDDPLLCQVNPGTGIRKITYGLGEGCDYQAIEVKGDGGRPVFTALCRKTGQRIPVRLNVYGNHMISNAMAALAVAAENGVPMEEGAAALQSFSGLKGRQQIWHEGGVTIIDDSYNASPVSMKAGIQVLQDMETRGRRIAVLADMKELGPEEKEFHRQVGRYIADSRTDLVLLFGPLSREIQEGIQESQKEGRSSQIECMWCSNKEELGSCLRSVVKKGDSVLFKGSNSMGLGEIAADLIKELGREETDGEVCRRDY